MEQRLKQRFEWLENQTTGTQLVGVALIFLICYQLSRAVWANMYNETNLYSPATAPLTHDFSVDPSGPAAAVNTMSTGSASDNSAVNQAGQAGQYSTGQAEANGGPWMPLPSGAYQRQLKIVPDSMWKYYKNRDIFLFEYTVPEGPASWEHLLVMQVDRNGNPLGNSAARSVGQSYYLSLGNTAQLGNPEQPGWAYHGWAKQENGGLKALVQYGKKLHFGQRDTEARMKVGVRYRDFYCFLLPLVGIPPGKTEPEVLSVASMKFDHGDQVHQDIFQGLMPDDYILQAPSLAYGALLAERGSWAQYTLTDWFNKIFQKTLPLFQQSPGETKEAMWTNMKNQKCSLPAAVPQPLNFFLGQADAEVAFGHHRKDRSLSSYNDLQNLLRTRVECFQQLNKSRQVELKKAV